MFRRFDKTKRLEQAVDQIINFNNDIYKLEHVCEKFTKLNPEEARFKESFIKYKEYSQKLASLRQLEDPKLNDEIKRVTAYLLLEANIISGFLKIMILDDKQ